MNKYSIITLIAIILETKKVKELLKKSKTNFFEFLKLRNKEKYLFCKN